MGLGDGDLSLTEDVGKGEELTGGEAVWRCAPLLAMVWEIVWLIQEAARDFLRAEAVEDSLEFWALLIGEGDRIRRFGLKAEGGFASNGLSQTKVMFEGSSLGAWGKDCLLVEWPEDEVSWICSSVRNDVCGTLKGKIIQIKMKSNTYTAVI